MCTCTSAASDSASESLLMNAVSYRRFRHASAKFAATDRDDLRIWLVREYISSRGNLRDLWNISIAAPIAF
jgi:hypothetical protein